MRPADLWRHSSFRLVLLVSLLTLTMLVLASGVGYGLMRAELAKRQDARVIEVFAAIEQTSLENDESDLIEAINARIIASPDLSTVYLLRNAAGEALVRNIEDVALGPGWATLASDRLGVPTDYPYRLFTGPVGRYGLTVGLTNADLDDLQEIVMVAFGWATVLAFLAALGVGVVLALRVQARLTAAEAAVARVAQGDLSARLPVSGAGDDLDRISAAINGSLTRLQAVVEAMGQVSADIAHDLRTPLNRLRLRVEAAAQKIFNGGVLAESGSAGGLADDLAEALAESDRIDAIFTALLRIAQIEGGARREKFALVDVAAVMAQLADVYAGVAEDGGQHLSCVVPAGAQVRGDRDLLTQAFANLIENAIRHCPPGTEIRCGVSEAEGVVTAFVSDSGPGIPEAERDKVLRRLYRLEKSRTTDGSGLGLALVKAVADLHGATLGLTDAEPGLRVALRFGAAG